MNAQTKESQAQYTPSSALAELMKGNERFINKEGITRDYLNQVNQTENGQYPFASVLSCIDSRIPTEIVFDQGVGDIFNARVAGNFVNEDILGSLEFACKLAGSKVIVVMGHTSCGAIKGACDNAELGNLTQMLDKLKAPVESAKSHVDGEYNSSNKAYVNKASELNVHHTIENIKSQSSVLNEMYENGEIDIVGAMYHVASGKVELLKISQEV